MKLKKLIPFALVLCLSLLCLLACTPEQTPEPTPDAPDDGTVNYTLTIKDGLGNQMSDIIVKIMQNDEQIKMIPYNGQTLTVTLPRGNDPVDIDLSLQTTL